MLTKLERKPPMTINSLRCWSSSKTFEVISDCLLPSSSFLKLMNPSISGFDVPTQRWDPPSKMEQRSVSLLLSRQGVASDRARHCTQEDQACKSRGSLTWCHDRSGDRQDRETVAASALTRGPREFLVERIFSDDVLRSC